MKNISKLLAFGFMGLALASCDDSYDDWSQPQQNPQEEITSLLQWHSLSTSIRLHQTA